MKKLHRLLNEPIIILAGNLGVKIRRAYYIRDAIETGDFVPSSPEQAALLYKHYKLTPNDVIDYGKPSRP